MKDSYSFERAQTVEIPKPSAHHIFFERAGTTKHVEAKHPDAAGRIVNSLRAAGYAVWTREA